MTVRVRIRICSKTTGKCVDISALVNSGYETFRPEILLPKRLAEFLGIPLTAPHSRVDL